MRTPGLRIPQQHGAWAMLYVPFLLGVAVAGRVDWAALWLLLAMTALFFGRESLWRLRRARRQRRVEPGLRRAFGVQLVVFVGASFLLLAVHRLWGLLPIGALAAALLAFNLDRAAQREERSIATELVAILGFAAAAPAALYATTGAWPMRSVWLWGACLLFFSSSVFHVKTCVLAVQPQRRAAFVRMRALAVTYHLGLAGIVALLIVLRLLHPLVGIAYAPVVLRALWGAARPPERLRLKRIGVLEIVYSVHFLVFASLGFRTA
jgi:hypothetical protein